MQDTGASVALVYLLLPSERVLHLAVVSGAPVRLTAPWAQVPLDSPEAMAQAVRERRLVWLGSQEEVALRNPRTGLLLPYDFMVAAAPMAHGTTVWGALVLVWPTRDPPELGRPERGAMDAFCSRAGLLLQQAADRGLPLLPGAQPRALSRRSPRIPGRAEALAAVEFAEGLPMGCWALDPDGRITFVNAAAAKMVGVDAAALLGARPEKVLPWLSDTRFGDAYRAAIVTRRPTSFTVLRPPDQWLSFRLYPHAYGISVQTSPATTGQAPTAAPWEQPAPPSESDQVIGVYPLTQLATTLTEAAGVHEVVAQVTGQLMPAIGAQALALTAVDEGRLRIIGHRGYTADVMNRFDAIPLVSRSPAAHVVAAGVPSFFATFADLERAYPAAPHDGKAAWAFLPLIASGRTFGSLVLSYDQPHPFPPAERAVLTSLAGLITQALDRASLYDAKHQLAHSLQNALLPHVLPTIPGFEVVARYLPTTRGIDVGGDFYDLIRCDATGAAAAIGDVEGHNVNAAALMGQVRTAVHAHATTGAPPGDVLARTNRLMADIGASLFASCLYVHLDLTHHRAHLATAGHPPPLLRHPDGRTEVLDLPPGLLLGIDPTAHYTTTEIPLPPGAVLALYTDGLVETPGTDIDDTIADLANQLTHSQDQTMDALADTLVHHATHTTLRNDDIALLLIQATN
ncbi:SpoIIE family protein phosphatase [Streptomyces sp. NBC_01724]|uniref:SpoIIE family protein phosphatase n=1 Tax=Streptomyces sp. NBC_01724 TaxID=2975922 RepID=UPI002E3523E8|nr:SpoIIE family protein phosphatase [Streptomyces sp. NBC_01724]